MNRVFREEKKYLISLPEALQACHRLAQVMHEDPHNGISGYPVRSLYFDTLDDRDFHEKAAGVELRRKLRLRCYDPAADFAMLEMKQKQGASQLKRSLRVTREDAQALTRGDYAPLLRYPEFCRGVLRADAQPVLSPQNDRRIQPQGIYRQGEQNTHYL